MKLCTLIPLASLALAACAAGPAPGHDQWARFGETTRAGPVTIRPLRLLEDSRCPMNARCVWAGRVMIEAALWESGRRRVAQIQSDKALPIAGGQLTMDAINPDSFMTNQKPKRPDYEFHFRFDRAR